MAGSDSLEAAHQPLAETSLSPESQARACRRKQVLHSASSRVKMLYESEDAVGKQKVSTSRIPALGTGNFSKAWAEGPSPPTELDKSSQKV